MAFTPARSASDAPNIQWDVFADWVGPQELSAAWAGTLSLEQAARRILREECKRLPELFADSNQKLQRWGGDPATREWDGFRPLRLSREEDWSDWLGELLREKVFLKALLNEGGLKLEHERDISLIREDVVEGRRADIVLRQGEAWAMHLEVKLWDESFEKTFDTAKKIRAKYADPRTAAEWHDAIVIPEAARGRWAACALKDDLKSQSIGVITWESIAIALRRALISATISDFRWMARAYDFCGAVEQKILGMPQMPVKLESLSLTRFAAALEFQKILEGALM